MTVTVLDVVGRRLDLTSYLGKADPWLDSRGEQPSLLKDQPGLALLLAGSALCSDARLEADRERPRYFQVVGEPTEGALVMAAARLGLWKGQLEHGFPRVAEVPFDAEHRRMTTVHQVPTTASSLPPPRSISWQWHRQMGGWPYVAFTKGAVDSLLSLCSEVWVNEQAEPMGGVWRDSIAQTNKELAQNGIRVLGVDFRPHLSPRLDGESLLEPDFSTHHD